MDALLWGNTHEDDISHTARYWKRKHDSVLEQLNTAQRRIKELEKELGGKISASAAQEAEALWPVRVGYPIR